MWYRLARTFIFLFILSSATSSEKDYIWRDYDGEIPEDAIIAGRNRNGENVYIGQAYIKNLGLIPVQLTRGTKTVHAAMNGPKRADDFIKILAGRQEEFTWVPATSATLHLDLLSAKPVSGGHADGLGRVYIGKVRYEGEIQIGKVDAFRVGDAKFWWVDMNAAQREATSYEVLSYQTYGISPSYVKSPGGKKVDRNL